MTSESVLWPRRGSATPLEALSRPGDGLEIYSTRPLNRPPPFRPVRTAISTAEFGQRWQPAVVSRRRMAGQAESYPSGRSRCGPRPAACPPPLGRRRRKRGSLRRARGESSARRHGREERKTSSDGWAARAGAETSATLFAAEGFPVQPEGSPPRQEGSLPQAEGLPLRPEGFPVQPEGSPARQEGFLPREEGYRAFVAAFREAAETLGNPPVLLKEPDAGKRARRKEKRTSPVHRRHPPSALR
jgi:hypothetical protein